MPTYANYLPDEILLEIIAYIEAWDKLKAQATLAQVCAVNRYSHLFAPPPIPCLHADIPQTMVRRRHRALI